MAEQQPQVKAQPLNGEPKARVIVAGASGFAGALAAQIVWRHPNLELVRITSRSDAGTRLVDLYPRYRVPLTLEELDFDDAESGCDIAIVAYPHGAAAPTVAAFRERGLRVVDLSADFRLRDPGTYEKWYGEPQAPELLHQAIYGLPELYRERIADADIVANPGCYPTAAILALGPLAGMGLIDSVVIDAKSGVSGAGRGGGDANHFVTITENVSPYKVTGHRHEPEIEQEIAVLSGKAGVGVTFVPHLVPLDQGELVSCYVNTTEELDQENLDTLYSRFYDEEQFVDVVSSPPGMRDVRDTNICRVHPTVGSSGMVMVFGVIDNLWKGAASQAVQNINLMVGLPEAEGLS